MVVEGTFHLTVFKSLSFKLKLSFKKNFDIFQDREVDGNALYDHSMRPAILPPETRKSQLYKSPAIFEQIDKRSIEVLMISK